MSLTVNYVKPSGMPLGCGARRLCLLLVALAFNVIAVEGAVASDNAVSPSMPGGEIDYEFAGENYHGFFVKPYDFDNRAPKSIAGIVIVPDAFGQTPLMRALADRLAQQGYAVLLADMYGRGVTPVSKKEAGIRARTLLEAPRQIYGQLLAAKSVLTQHPVVDSDRVGVLGYGDGGAMVLSMVEAGIDFAAAATVSAPLSYPSPEEKLAKHKLSLLMLQGGADSTLPGVMSERSKLEQRFKSVTNQFRWVIYPGVPSGFYDAGGQAFATEFQSENNYHGEADGKAWQALTDFFYDLLKT